MTKGQSFIREAIDAKTMMGGVYQVRGVAFKSLVSTFHAAPEIMVIVADGQDSIHHLVEKVARQIPQEQLTKSLIEGMECLQGNDSDIDVRSAQLEFWRLFSHQIEHVLFVDDADWIKPILNFYESDPIAAGLNSDLVMNGKGRTILARPIEGINSQTIDLTDSAAQSIRDLLTHESTIARIVDLVGSDLGRFEALLEEPSESKHRLNFYRYLSRTSDERTLLNILAVYGTCIQPNLLSNCATLIGKPAHFKPALNALIDANLIERRILDGQVTLALFEKEIATQILAEIDEEVRKDIHLKIAQSAHEERYPAAMVCDHFFKAQSHLAVNFVEHAIRELRLQGELEKSVELYQNWIELETDEERLHKARFGLVETLEKLGMYQKAYSLFEDDEKDPSSLRLKASLLIRLDRCEDAIAALKGDTSTQALFLICEANYSLGLHNQTLDSLLPFVQAEPAEGVSSLEHSKNLLKARSEIARVYIVQRKLEEASVLLRENLALAEASGWKRDIVQAKTDFGIIALIKKDYAKAKADLEGALSHAYHTNGHLRLRCLINLAILSQCQRKFGDAIRSGLVAIREAKRIGDMRLGGIALRNLATVYQSLGAFQKAEYILTVSLDMETEEGSLGSAWNLFILATMLQDADELERALDFYTELSTHKLASTFEPILSIQMSRIKVSLGLPCDLVDREFEHSEFYEGFELLRRAEKTSDSKRKVAMGRRAASILLVSGRSSTSFAANLAVLSGLRELGRNEEARAEMRAIFKTVKDLGENFPEEYQFPYFQRPILKKLGTEASLLELEVPEKWVAQRPLAAQRFERTRFANFVGEDPSLHRIFRLIDKVAPSDATVLVYGESGTGKELVAEALHKESKRSAKPFIKVNCAALAEDLLLSELFGHEKGAFTGAIKQKVGRFELADGGTLFLDEIGDVSPNLQVSLLRVLQEGSFEKVGGTKTQHVNVRVVAATNKDLEQLVRQGKFRLDLYYRLKGVVIETPSLRNRRPDIGRLAQYFVKKADPAASISPAVIQTLSRYSWPGNIRELQNFIQSVLLFVEGSVVERQHIDEFRDFFISGEFDNTLPDVGVNYLEYVPVKEKKTSPKVHVVNRSMNEDSLEDAIVHRVIEKGESLAELKKRLEIECIRAALQQTDGNVTKAAKILQMKRPRLSQIIGDNPDLVALKTRLTA